MAVTVRGASDWACIGKARNSARQNSAAELKINLRMGLKSSE